MMTLFYLYFLFRVLPKILHPIPKYIDIRFSVMTTLGTLQFYFFRHNNAGLSRILAILVRGEGEFAVIADPGWQAQTITTRNTGSWRRYLLCGRKCGNNIGFVDARTIVGPTIRKREIILWSQLTIKTTAERFLTFINQQCRAACDLLEINNVELLTICSKQTMLSCSQSAQSK